jgi:hypothetical protein
MKPGNEHYMRKKRRINRRIETARQEHRVNGNDQTRLLVTMPRWVKREAVRAAKASGGNVNDLVVAAVVGCFGRQGDPIIERSALELHGSNVIDISTRKKRSTRRSVTEQAVRQNHTTGIDGSRKGAYPAKVLVRMLPSVKAALVSEARARGTNVNDVAVAALADRFGVGFDPSGRYSSASPKNLKVLLRMSDELKDAIEAHAYRNRSNQTDTVVRILADYFGVKTNVPPPIRTTPFGGGRRKWAA